MAAIGTLAGFGFHHSEGLAAVALVETNCNTSAGDAFMHTRMHMLAQYMSRGMPRMHEVQTKFTRTHARTLAHAYLRANTLSMDGQADARHTRSRTHASLSVTGSTVALRRAACVANTIRLERIHAMSLEWRTSCE